jgi:CRISPR system Cascade subunit CasE
MIELHLLQCVLDTRAVLAFAKTQGLLTREVDEGYLVHAALAALFGDHAPRPFVLDHMLDPRPRTDDASPSQVVLAYSRLPFAELRDRASDANRVLVRWERSASKPMPEIASGREVGFVTRVTPTVRSRAGRPGEPEGGRGHEREIDAFLAACFHDRDAVIDRATVYHDWLAHKLSASRDGAPSPAVLTDFSLRRFERATLLRKEQSVGNGRKRHVLERPDVVVAGALRVADADAFRAVLARGVGRHRAFGFGMLLLRPSRS